LTAFGKAVRQLRKARGFSQEAFADECGIDRSYMGGVERGERNIALINIGKIVTALGMQPSEFFKALDMAEDKPPAAMALRTQPSGFGRALGQLVDGDENHLSRHEAALKELAHLLAEEVYRQLLEKDRGS